MKIIRLDGKIYRVVEKNPGRKSRTNRHLRDAGRVLVGDTVRFSPMVVREGVVAQIGYSLDGKSIEWIRVRPHTFYPKRWRVK